MNSSDLNEMISLLGLTDKPHWDLALYLLFVINLALLMMQSDGAAFGTLLSIIVLISVVIDKVYGFGYMLDPGPYDPKYCHAHVFIGTYLIRVAMFIAPWAIAGMTRSGKVRGVGILAGIFGLIYMSARWYFDLYHAPVDAITCSYLFIGGFFQYAGMGLVIVRRRLTTFTIYRDVPLTIAGDFAPNDVEK